jgi:hypothetical protein
MSLFSNEILEDSVKKISENSDSWLSQYKFIAPKAVTNRRKYIHGARGLAQTIIGFFINPLLGKTENVYIFEGIRNKEYMAIFRADSVVIVGSHLEKAYAKAHGYGFCWSFPMVSATQSKMGRDWNYPAIRQLRLWLEILSKFKKATFFLYEDTQPLGVFFVHVSKLMQPNVSTVCIQHGYFTKTNYPIRLDGILSDINFVWDCRQAELIGSNPVATFEIGLPYFATAKQTNEINVVLVGTGMASYGTNVFQRCINTYVIIHTMLANRKGINIFYKPHPNEYNDEKTLDHLREKFNIVDNPDKQKLLNGPRSIFIGTESSLLYEAGIAGHLVAHWKFGADEIPVFDFDFEFEENEMSELLQWILNMKNKNLVCNEDHITRIEPLERFKLALCEAKIPF